MQQVLILDLARSTAFLTSLSCLCVLCYALGAAHLLMYSADCPDLCITVRRAWLAVRCKTVSSCSWQFFELMAAWVVISVQWLSI